MHCRFRLWLALEQHKTRHPNKPDKQVICQGLPDCPVYGQLTGHLLRRPHTNHKRALRTEASS